MSDLSRNRRLAPDLDRDAPDGLADLEDGVITLPGAAPGQSVGSFDPKTETLSIPTEDGGVVIQLNARDPEEDEPDDDAFYVNLAEKITPEERGRIVDEVLRGIEADDQSRQEWLETRAEGIKMLGTTLEKAQTDMGSSTGPFEGMSTVRHPLLLEAVTHFQANAGAELYPPSGPVKVRDDRPSKPPGVPEIGIGHNGGPPLDPAFAPNDPTQMAEVAAAEQAGREEIAEALEKGFNHNLTVGDRAYRPDAIRMLFWVGFGGCGFRKIYDDPIKRRPVSRYVDAADIIVNNSVSDHRDAGRITHRIVMRPSLVRRMQLAGVYRDIELHEPQYQPNVAEEAVAHAQGLEARPQRQEDQPRTLYESYVELDVQGHEHSEAGKPTGIPLPYKVTIDKDARELLELRCNWEEDDDTYAAREVFVKFSFIPGLGFYDLGLLHLLGNGDRALTAAWRIALDTGMFGNFPGFIYNEGAIRNWTNQGRVPPGGGLGIKGIGNLPLDQVIKPLPYKDVGAGLIGIIDKLEQRMDRVANTGDLPVGEGRQDAPVGTTLALLEQATKVIAAVHIGLHDSQAQELELLKERYKADPESFWRGNKKARAWEKEEFLRALEDNDITPAADPNTASHVIRLIKCQAVKTVAQMNPTMYDMQKVDAWIFKMIGVSDPEQFFAPPVDPSQQGPDPQTMLGMATLQQKTQQLQQQGQQKQAELALKAQEAAAEHQARMSEIQADAAEKQQAGQQRAQEIALQSADRAADRQSEERRQQLGLQVEVMKQNREHAHDVLQTATEHQHEAVQTAGEQRHQADQATRQQQHQTQQQERQQSQQGLSTSPPYRTF